MIMPDQSRSIFNESLHNFGKQATTNNGNDMGPPVKYFEIVFHNVKLPIFFKFSINCLYQTP